MQDRDRSQPLILAATSVSYVLVILDTSIVNVALARIADGLGADVAALQWIVNAYTVVFASLLLTGGTLGDRYGARRVYLAGFVLFTLASALCGAAPSLAVLIGARVLQGVGAALLVPCSLTLLNHAFRAPGARAKAIGVWTGCGGAALAAGPLAGGVLIGLFGWRAIFLVNLPIGAFGLWLTARIPAARANAAEARPLDLPGQASAIVALAALVGGAIEGPSFGWASAPILACWIVGLAAAALFLAIEWRRRAPMLPLSFFANGTVSASALVALVTTLGLFGLLFVLSLYFQQLRGYSPLETGLAFLPLTAVVTVTNLLAGRMTKTHGPRLPILLGLLALIAGCLGLLPVGAATSYAVLVAPLLALGLAGGFVTPAVAAALIGAVEKRRSGIASGVLNTARQLGVALGVAGFGALIAGEGRMLSGLHAALVLAVGAAALAAVAAALTISAPSRR